MTKQNSEIDEKQCINCGGDYYFFEIAIYRCTPDDYHSEMKQEKQRYLGEMQISIKESPETYKVAEQHFDRNHWAPWYYNQTIGWLQLYIIGTSIRCEYFFIDAKRITRRIKQKRFLWHGKAFELTPSPLDSSETIYKSICDAIKGLNSRTFKRRYIDLEKFNNIGPFVNWRVLLGFKEEEEKE